MLWSSRIEMRPEGDGTVGLRAAKGKTHPSAQVVVRPVGAILSRCRKRALERSIKVGPPRPGKSLVEMGMKVDETRPDHAGSGIDPARRPIVTPVSGESGDASVGDPDI